MLLETLDLNPHLIYAHSMLGLVAVLQNDCDEAARQFAWSGGGLPEPAKTLGMACLSACRGQTRRTRRYLRAAARHITPGNAFKVARGYALLHDSGAAIAWLRKSPAAALRSSLREPFFDGLRSDPRYAALEKTAGLRP
jgi:hypothetical protein